MILAAVFTLVALLFAAALTRPAHAYDARQTLRDARVGTYGQQSGDGKKRIECREWTDVNGRRRYSCTER